MGTRKIRDARDFDTKEKIYFKGHAEATYMSDGRTVEKAVNEAASQGSVTQYRVFGMTDASESPNKDHIIYIESNVPITEEDEIVFARHLRACSVYGDRENDQTYRYTRKYTACPWISTSPYNPQPENRDYTKHLITLTVIEVSAPNEKNDKYWYQLMASENGVFSYAATVGCFICENSWFGHLAGIANKYMSWKWGKSKKRINTTSGANASLDAGFLINGQLVPFTMTYTCLGDNGYATYIK